MIINKNVIEREKLYLFFIIFVFKFENTYKDNEILMNANKS